MKNLKKGLENMGFQRKIIIMVVFLFSIMFLSACSKDVVKNEAVVQEFSLKELCAQDGNMFMTMGPILDGTPTGEVACPGCMIGNSHICDIETYLEVSGK
jgi:hypothetical protein